MGRNTEQKKICISKCLFKKCDASNEVTVGQDKQAEKKKDDFYDFQSDDESDVQSNVETEANDYLNNAKTIENL